MVHWFQLYKKEENKKSKGKRKDDATGIPVCRLFFSKKVFSTYPLYVLAVTLHPITSREHRLELVVFGETAV
jgi:hypothetical protein